MSDYTFPYAPESAAVEEAASQALHLIESYTFQETNDPHGPWRQPDTILQSLDAARNELTNAWKQLSSKMSQDETQQGETTRVNEEDFRVAYVNMVTDAFADVLEDLRKNDKDFDVDVLVDCLQSGIELIPGEDREFWRKELEETNDDDNGERPKSGDDLTPHARRRRDLGYCNVQASSL